MPRVEHPPKVREVLRKAGLSEQTELSAEEARNMPAAMLALRSNPTIRQNTLLRILRPLPDDPL